MYPSATAPRGFTLIELSIVLVIIGLIVGSVLVGQDLIRAAAVRALIAQIEKYNTAVNTFRGKFGALPGDMNAATASQFGFAARGPFAGEGDGNGVIEGVTSNSAGQNWGRAQGTGETALFWVDLSASGLMDGGFSTATATTYVGTPYSLTSTPGISAFLPAAKLGRGNYIYVYSGGPSPASTDGTNYFGLSAVNWIGIPSVGEMQSTATLTVQEAYSIDKKMDDGIPLTGNITVYYVTGNQAAVPSYASSGSSSTCYDYVGAGVGGGPTSYSIEINGGAGVNCALSFRFQ